VARSQPLFVEALKQPGGPQISQHYRAGAVVRLGTLDEWWWRIIQFPSFFSNTKVYRETQTSDLPLGSILK
jgi:hypothetical protein